MAGDQSKPTATVREAIANLGELQRRNKANFEAAVLRAAVKTPQLTIPPPSKEVLRFLQWAAAMLVFELDISDDDRAACRAVHAWLDEIEKACGYDR